MRCKVDFITAKTLIEYEKSGHAVHVYPRRHIACVDGGKYFKVNHGTVKKWKYYKKTGVEVQDETTNQT